MVGLGELSMAGIVPAEPAHAIGRHTCGLFQQLRLLADCWRQCFNPVQHGQVGSGLDVIDYVIHPRCKHSDIFPVERCDEAGIQRPHDLVRRVVRDMLQVFQLSG